MKLDGKTIYAQSSDIKSRTYLEYRKDMKKKAIAELEVLEWLKVKFRKQFPNKVVQVYKSGGDKFLWFLREGGISREPDFIAEIDNEKIEIEFQYGGCDIQEDYVFDFKTSKVGKKIKGLNERKPKNTIFLYLFREAPTKFAFMTAEWILKNSTKGFSAAWGNREVYKLTGKEMLKVVKEDKNLQHVWDQINAKLNILDFQHELIDINKNRLSHLLQSVIDENEIVKIIPKDLYSYFRVCFILDHLNKIPKNANIWLVYLLSFINSEASLKDISKIVYCIDFLYSKIELKSNELVQLIIKIEELMKRIKSYYKNDGSYRSSLKESPIDETRYALFSINLLEDLIQDIIFYYSDIEIVDVKKLKPIKKIYENIEDIDKTYKFFKDAK